MCLVTRLKINFLIFAESWVILTFIMMNMSCADAYVYSSNDKRDPFVPLVGASAISTGYVPGDISSINDIKLQGIIIDPDGTRSAVINGEILKEGQTFGSAKVEKIDSDAISVSIGGKTYKLDL